MDGNRMTTHATQVTRIRVYICDHCQKRTWGSADVIASLEHIRDVLPVEQCTGEFRHAVISVTPTATYPLPDEIEGGIV